MRERQVQVQVEHGGKRQNGERFDFLIRDNEDQMSTVHLKK